MCEGCPESQGDVTVGLGGEAAGSTPLILTSGSRRLCVKSVEDDKMESKILRVADGRSNRGSCVRLVFCFFGRFLFHFTSCIYEPKMPIHYNSGRSFRLFSAPDTPRAPQNDSAELSGA